MDACTALSDSIARLAERGHSNRHFLKELGRAAGVRRGLFWVTDAGTGGSNRLRGRGFEAHVDDDTDGQARHFAGIVAVSARIGARLTRWASVTIGRDAPDTADGRLTDLALEFSRLIRSGELAQGDAAAWVRSNLCSAPSADAGGDAETARG